MNQNKLKSTWRWLPEERQMLWKGTFSEITLRVIPVSVKNICEKFDVNGGQEIEEHKKVAIHENGKNEINKYENDFVQLGY